MTNVAPSGNYVQQEGINYQQPVSESTTTSIAALTSYLRETLLPIGSVSSSMLTEGQFDSQLAASQTRWVLADGRSCVGSTYATITGNTNVPDLRGIALRGKNNGVSTGYGNPDGDLALGTYTADRFLNHNHNLTDPGHSHGMGSQPGFVAQNTEVNFGPGGSCFVTQTNGSTSNAFPVVTSGTGITLAAVGGVDTSPRNITINWFIRIN